MRYLKINPKDIGPGGALAFARKLAARKPGKPTDGSAAKHSQLQADAEQYCKVHDLATVNIPDEMLRFVFGTSVAGVLQHHAPGLYGWLQGVRRAISQSLLGCPDLIILRKHGDWNQSFCAEFKTGASKPRKGQKKFAEKANVRVFRDYESFKLELDRWLDADI